MDRAEEPVPRLSVLVVEDDVDTANSYEMLLGLYGYHVRLAPDGVTALRLAAALAPDVVLIDHGLPEMDGCELAQRLRRDSSDRRPLLVAITGFADEDHRRRSSAAGIDLHLTKPADPEKLLRLLRRFERILAVIPAE